MLPCAERLPALPPVEGIRLVMAIGQDAPLGFEEASAAESWRALSEPISGKACIRSIYKKREQIVYQNE
jgi:hypothetical protein